MEKGILEATFEQQADQYMVQGFYHKASKIYLSLLEPLLKSSKTREAKRREIVNLSLKYSESELKAGHYRSAKNLLETTLRQLENEKVELYSNEIAQCFFFQGEIEKSLENFEDASKKFSQAFELMEKSTHHILLLKIQNSIGEVKYNKGNLDEAYNIFKETLSTCTDSFGEENDLVAQIYNNLANSWFDIDSHKSYDFYKKSLDLKLKIHGPQHPEIALSYFNLAYWHSNEMEYEKSIEFLSKAIEIYEKREICEHCNVAMCYKCLGNVYFHKGDSLNGLRCFQRALKIKLKNPEMMKGKLDLCLGDMSFHMSEILPSLAKDLAKSRYYFVKNFMPEAHDVKADAKADIMLMEQQFAKTKELTDFNI